LGCLFQSFSHPCHIFYRNIRKNKVKNLHNRSWFCYIMSSKERSIIPSCLLVILPYFFCPRHEEFFFVFDQLLLIHLKIFKVLLLILCWRIFWGSIFRVDLFETLLCVLHFRRVIVILYIHSDIMEVVIMDYLRVRINPQSSCVFYSMTYWVISLIKWYIIKLNIRVLNNSVLRIFIFITAFSVTIWWSTFTTLLTILLYWSLSLIQSILIWHPIILQSLCCIIRFRRKEWLLPLFLLILHHEDSWSLSFGCLYYFHVVVLF
jgi:hypothetical protein